MAEPFLAEIRIMSFNFAPKGWALCNGQLLPINQNQALFSLLGTTYGGDGQSNFALPDLQGACRSTSATATRSASAAGERGAHAVDRRDARAHHVVQASQRDRRRGDADRPTSSAAANALYQPRAGEHATLAPSDDRATSAAASRT